MQTISSRGAADRSVLLALWLVVTAANLFKPFHIDDTAHLLIARWIAENPLEPMRGLLNWDGVPEPIWKTNQPHLYFYLLAGWGSLLGYGEPAMHALQSLFSGAAIVLFHRLARMIAPAHALWATAMLALGPAFVIGQNLMLDVPLLAMWLLFFTALLRTPDDPPRLATAAIAAGAAVLTKYSSLILLPILGLAIVIDRTWRKAWVMLIPLAVLAGWSLFNVADYGGVHILERGASTGGGALDPRRVLRQTISWLVALGALLPLGPLILAEAAARRGIALLIYAGISAAFIAIALAVTAGLLTDTAADLLLAAAFFGNALLMLAVAWPALRSALGLRWWQQRVTGPERASLLLLAWLGCTFAFYALFSPFIAARHVLLVLPPVLLLFAGAARLRLPARAKAWSLGFTALITAGLAVADWQQADFARAQAGRLAAEAPPGTTIWTTGHWGWQWYAAQQGIRQIDVRNPAALRPGDWLIVTTSYSLTPLPRLDALRLVRRDRQRASGFNPLCTGRPASFYLSTHKQPPWTLSRDCADFQDVYAVMPGR